MAVVSALMAVASALIAVTVPTAMAVTLPYQATLRPRNGLCEYSSIIAEQSVGLLLIDPRTMRAGIAAKTEALPALVNRRGAAAAEDWPG